MGDGSLQTKLVIILMLAIFVGVCAGAAIFAYTGYPRNQVKLPDPFRTSVTDVTPERAR